MDDNLTENATLESLTHTRTHHLHNKGETDMTEDITYQIILTLDSYHEVKKSYQSLPP